MGVASPLAPVVETKIDNAVSSFVECASAIGIFSSETLKWNVILPRADGRRELLGDWDFLFAIAEFAANNQIPNNTGCLHSDHGLDPR